MRYHGAAHVWRRVFQELGTEITGGQLAVDRDDLILRADFTKKRLKKFSATMLWLLFPFMLLLPKGRSAARSTLFKLANKEYIEKLQEVRVVDIGFDKQADGERT